MVTALLAALALTASHPDAGRVAVVDAGAAATDYTAEAQPSTPKMGEPFVYAVSVTHPRDEVFSLPKDADLGDFDLVSSSKDDVPTAEGVKTVLRLVLRGWAIGSKAIPDLQLEVQKAQGVSRFTVPGVTVELTGALDPDGGSESPLREIAPPVIVHVRTYRVLAGLAALLAALVAGYFLVGYLRREKPAFVAPPPPPIPAHVRARTALELLLGEDLPAQGRQREFYFRLSEVVRRYLGERFGFEGLDLTTEELLAVLRTRHTPGLDFTGFKRFCEESDLAKFAKFQPDASACKSSIDAALHLVQTTTPAPAFAGEVKG